MDKIGYSILVDLDAILDTRLGTLGVLDEGIGKKMSLSRLYVERETDVFSKIDPNVDDSKYNDLYLKRNENTLRLSVMTDIPYQLGIGLRSLIPQVNNGLIDGNIEIVINTYPYKLSSDIKRLIARGVKMYIEDPVRVVSKYIDVYALTPNSIKDTYDEWYAYDIDQWLAIHQTEILTCKMKKVMITLPRISTSGQMPDNPEVDPFSAKELVFSSFFKLVHINASYYTYNHDMTVVRRNQSLSSIQSSGDKGTSP